MRGNLSAYKAEKSGPIQRGGEREVRQIAVLLGVEPCASCSFNVMEGGRISEGEYIHMPEILALVPECSRSTAATG